MNTLHPFEQMLDMGSSLLPFISSIEGSMGPRPTPSSRPSSQVPSRSATVLTWATSQAAATPTPTQRTSSQLQSSARQPSLNEQELLMLMELAVAYWRLRRGKGGVKRFDERVRDDFTRDLGRPFISSRRKVITTVEYYEQLFKNEGSHTGVQSESELVGVMRVLVDLWQKEKATAKGKEVDSRTTEKESRRAAKDRDNMLRRASDKARSDDEVSGLGSGYGSSDDEDQTSCEDAPAPAPVIVLEDTTGEPASPDISRRSTSTSVSRGRGRHRNKGRRKHARDEDDADRDALKEILASMAADRELRQQELALQRERRIAQELKDNASLEFMKKLGEALISRMT